MKSGKLFCLYLLLLVGIIPTVQGQAPQSFKYQAVVRNAAGYPVSNRSVRFEVMLTQGNYGPIVYSEQHSVTTDTFGLAQMYIGRGTLINSSPALSTINWGNGSYFLSLTFDSTGSGSFTPMGSFELLSVPYALSSANGMPQGTAPGNLLYWNGTTWLQIPAGAHNSTLRLCNGVPSWGVCYPVGTVHCTPTPTTVIEVLNPTTNRIWMDRNLGASQVATSPSNSSAYGDLYQWGRGSDGHQCRNSTTTSVLSMTDQPGNSNYISNTGDWRSPQNNNLWQGVGGINNPCPDGFRIPTEAEWTSERTSWSSSNSTGAFNSPLKLTLAGYRTNSGFLLSAGTSAFYWSSTTSSSNVRSATFTGSNSGSGIETRGLGATVRCIKD
jgi:hypothetical protein